VTNQPNWPLLRRGDYALATGIIAADFIAEMQFDRKQIKISLAQLAARGVFIGTSSWKYSGWRGMLYDEQRYIYRGKFAESRFEKNCLAEYAEVFKTVCVDAGYYRFPDHRYIEALVSQVPPDFLFTFKVTDEITIKKCISDGPPGVSADYCKASVLHQLSLIQNSIRLLCFCASE
jgi:hypothetical protein